MKLSQKQEADLYIGHFESENEHYRMKQHPKFGSAKNSCLIVGSLVLCCHLTTFQVSLAADEIMPLPAPDFKNQPKLDKASVASAMPPLQGRVGSFDILIDELQNKFRFHCRDGAGGSLLVEGVSPGTVAYQAGLRDGDEITNAVRKQDHFELSIHRSGQRSLIKLVPKSDNSISTSGQNQQRISRPAFPLNAEQRVFTDPRSPQLDASGKRDVFSASITKSAKLLSNYNLELIVDRSLSMRKRDCPGYSSRWGWCGMQAEELGRQLASASKQGMTITTFAGNYNVYENQSPTQVENVFNFSRLELGTCLGEPLDERLNKALWNRRKTGKPTLIVVITDGVPHPRYEPRLVVDVLINATRQMSNPDEIKVVFMQIGAEDIKGQNFLANLDHRLVNIGARYDIVQTVHFNRLQQVGLAQALAESLSEFNSRTSGMSR